MKNIAHQQLLVSYVVLICDLLYTRTEEDKIPKLIGYCYQKFILAKELFTGSKEQKAQNRLAAIFWQQVYCGLCECYQEDGCDIDPIDIDQIERSTAEFYEPEMQHNICSVEQATVVLDALTSFIQQDSSESLKKRHASIAKAKKLEMRELFDAKTVSYYFTEKNSPAPVELPELGYIDYRTLFYQDGKLKQAAAVDKNKIYSII